MVAASAAGSPTVSTSAGPQPSAGGRPHAALSYTAGDPEATVQVLQEVPSQQGGTEAVRLPDRGQDIPAQVNAINANLSRMEKSLSEVRYDKTTGEPTYIIQGQARAALEAQFQRARAAAAFDLAQLQALADQRQADEAGRQPELERQAKIAQWVNGDPAKRAAVERALIERGAADLVDQILGRKP